MSEPRHVSLECQFVFGGTAVALRVRKQTHREEEFGSGGETFVASNGLRLSSAVRPEWCPPGELCVRGTARSCDDVILLVCRADFERIAQAVREYNWTFASKPDAPVEGVFIVE